MIKPARFLTLSALIFSVAACSGGLLSNHSGAGNSASVLPVSVGDDLAIVDSSTLPAQTVGEELPGEGVGSYKDHTWGLVGGFTQTKTAQTLAFAPGTTITIRNLSKSIEHTFNVVKVVNKPPADFPTNVNLSVNAHGGNELQTGYASGVIAPGKSVKVKLLKSGMYLIGCAFHYDDGMRDVIIIEKGAKPGPTATPNAKPTSSPTSDPTYSPPPGGYKDKPGVL